MKYLHIIILLFIASTCSMAQSLPYRYFTPVCASPSEEASCLFFDHEGLMWIGTYAGVKVFDGYQTKIFKSNAYQPGILPNNTIRSITEDYNNCMWLGTRNGLVKMDKRTGQFHTYYLPELSQRTVYTLYTSKDGTVWVGTDGGLSYYDRKHDSFYTYDHSNTWLIDENGDKARITNYSVKAILEDTNGDLLVGTWQGGLLRMKRGTDTFRRYPRLNERNSAYSLFFDKHHRLWVGTWGYGVMRIDNPRNVEHPQIHHYPYTSNHFDIFYKFVEDPVTQKLWACTREGVCTIDEDNPDASWQQYTKIGSWHLNYCNDIATDNCGNIWVNTQNNGIFQVNTSTSPFKQWQLDMGRTPLTVNFISSILTTDGNTVWLGLNPYGIACHDKRTGSTHFNAAIPGFGTLPTYVFTTSISNILHRSNGELWFAVNNYGIIVRHADGHTSLVNQKVAPYIEDDYVNTFYESSDKTVWIGQRSGMSILKPDGQGMPLTMKQGTKDFSRCDILHITSDRQGHIWVSTNNEGIICISGNPARPATLRYRQYAPCTGKLAVENAQACLADSRGRLWAISSSGGLFLYDKEQDAFLPMNRKYHIPGDRVLAIMEDALGNLWLTIDNALVHIVWDKDSDDMPKETAYFTGEDGLGDIHFSANSCYRYGNELYFGGRNNFFSFTPDKNIGKEKHSVGKNLLITDLYIDDIPFALLDSAMRQRISAEAPAFARHITIPSKVRKFAIGFSLLTYGNTQKNMYAYQLEGYDDDWQFCTDEQHHRAVFQNLSPGTYRLHVKATDNYGQWQKLPYTLEIKVLPPWYASPLAFIIYFMLIILAVFGVARWYKEHLKTKNRLQMGVILTNITHELLTPLTVISATIYKLKMMAPQYEGDYQVVDNNINRTTRLLRQILEVRKSQAGQLRLLVKRDSLSAFIAEACDGIRPMALHRNIRLIQEGTENEAFAWFDSDKLDKILYNLLSNAIKYNKEGGTVWVSLHTTQDKATICIRDNGIGMSADMIKHLYTRFFDGDYRKQNIQGTGIGLSLTHDLVRLHHGNIHCESAEGEGTTFTITLPTRMSAYGKHEIDNTSARRQIDQTSVMQVTEQNEDGHETEPIVSSTKAKVRTMAKGSWRILIVEDNEELLSIMQQVLSRNYEILTARNGKQALGIIQREKLDLVVSDVMMPVMDGMELTHRIKEDKSYWQLPVVLLTAKNKEEDRFEGYATGADAYITKPFRMEQLEIRIQTLITNRQKIREKFSVETTDAASSAAQQSEITQTSHYSDPEQAFVEKATQIILQHIGDDEYNREALAKEMMMSGSTLYNKIKSATGQTVTAFITSIRLKEAARILRQSPDILISDLALRVGFNTPKYFSRCFKKEFGVFPKEYVEKEIQK